MELVSSSASSSSDVTLPASNCSFRRDLQSCPTPMAFLTTAPEDDSSTASFLPDLHTGSTTSSDTSSADDSTDTSSLPFPSPDDFTLCSLDPDDTDLDDALVADNDRTCAMFRTMATPRSLDDVAPDSVDEFLLDQFNSPCELGTELPPAFDDASVDDLPFASAYEVRAEPCVYGIETDATIKYHNHRICVLRKTPKGMIDSGANICMTDNLDILSNVVNIVPFSISLAVETDGSPARISQCTKKGILHLTKSDGGVHPQICYYNADAAETIISPTAICADSKGVLTSWSLHGNSTKEPGSLKFQTTLNKITVDIPLHMRNGLYYCNAESFVLAKSTPFPDFVQSSNAPLATASPPVPLAAKLAKPTTRAKQIEAELWSARLGFPAEWQLDVITDAADGLPDHFAQHPFSKHLVKADAAIAKQPSGKTPTPVSERGQRFYADFGFMRASTFDYSKPSPDADRVIQSYDGYNSYLIIVDEVSRFIWVFLCKNKEPPIDIMGAFLTRFGHSNGGLLRTDLGGELARSTDFRTIMKEKYNYVVETTGADSPSQNGQVEKYNGVLAITVRVLLYSAGLHAKFWSAALLHAVYLHNRRCHRLLKITPFEAWYGIKPNLKHLKIFGSRVSVKRTGKRRAKLDRHSFRGIFLGYSATDHNIRYIDTTTGITKRSHHAVFDEAWYTADRRPPAAQFLYDLGLTADDTSTPGVAHTPPPPSFYPPVASSSPTCMTSTKLACLQPLPWNIFPTPALAAAAATTIMLNPPTLMATRKSLPPISTPAIHDILEEYLISKKDMAMIYMSPSPYDNAFEESLDLRHFSPTDHPTAGLSLISRDNRLFLASMSPGQPGAKIPRWRSRLKEAWLISINGTPVSTHAEARQVFAALASSRVTSCSLLFSHPEIKHGLTNDGIPQINLDQLNNRLLLRPNDQDIRNTMPLGSKYSHHFTQDDTDEHDVLNCVTKVSKLTRSKLHKQDDWDDWQQSEFLQLDQYASQFMFGDPVKPPSQEAIFNLVWSYVEKVLDGRKKARCTADGSARNGMVRVLDQTYANCIDHTGARIFYAASAVENLIIFGSDVSNAFGEAPPPKQGCFIRPDRAFHDWWVLHLGNPPIPQGFVIPILAAIQGHPESPRLWEKHVDRILRHIGFLPTVHEPCLYTGEIDGQRVLFMRQVDDFACAAQSARIAGLVWDLLDDYLYLPIKRQGIVTLFNGLDLHQTKHFVKLGCSTYLERICDKYQNMDWMRPAKVSADRPTPLPNTDSFNREYLAAVGDPDPGAQDSLSKTMGVGFRNIIGELTYAMITCRPDVSFATVKSAQASAAPARIHYEAAKHTLRYLYITRTDGIYFWRSSPCDDLPDVPLPTITSNVNDLLLDNRSSHTAYDVHGFVDSDWAACPKTRRSFSGICIRLAGGTIAYKSRLQPTVSQSSTEAEFIAAADAGKMILYIRSILFDLGIPQQSASLLYEDNDGCIAMANAGKPTSRTRHIDIKYHAICEWVERDLMLLERVPTSQNMSDHFTKNLPKILFHRHVDFVLGHIPPPHSPAYGHALGPAFRPPPSHLQPKKHSPAAAAARVVHLYRCYATRSNFLFQGIW